LLHRDSAELSKSNTLWRHTPTNTHTWTIIITCTVTSYFTNVIIPIIQYIAGKFGSRPLWLPIETHQYFSYSHIVILYRTTKLKHTNIFAYLWDPTAKFNFGYNIMVLWKFHMSP
jgi:hypothetical protein